MSQMVVMDQPAGAYNPAVPGLSSDPELQHCIQCGSCSGICPWGYAMEFPPSRMISALRAGVYDSVTASESVWMCIACSACTTACPTLIPITENLMARTKEELILAGNVPAELQSALEYSQRYGNPLGESPRKRAAWVEKAEVPVPVLGKDNTEVDVLWFVGDYPSYHVNVIPSAIAFAKILNALGVNFGILGRQEQSDGDSQRLAGENGLFEMLAEKNAKAFSKYSFKEIVTTDPHAYNALKNAYPEMGISYPVKHYTQFLAERLDELKPLLTREIGTLVTYHDPCYLGRVNDIYEEPRALIQALPGIELVEMAHSRENSLCCGGGGGGMWMDGFQWEKTHARTSEWRICEAVAEGADIMVVACPYEKPRFEDAVKVVAGDTWKCFGSATRAEREELDKAVTRIRQTQQLQILDLAELLLSAMDI